MRLRDVLKIFAGLFIWLLFFGPLSFSFAQEPQPSGEAGPAKSPKIIEENRNSFTINFKDVELEQIVKVFSDITGKNFILEQVPKGKITIISPVRIPKNQALPIFEAILNLNGYNMVATSITNLYRIIPISEAVKANLPIYLPGEPPPRPGENYIVRFIPLDYLSAQDAANLIQPILSKEAANAVPYLPTNTLIIVDTALNINRILRVLKALDVPTLQPEMEIVSLRYSAASEMASLLGQIFGEQAGGRTGTPVPVRPPGGRPPTEPVGGGLKAGPQVKIIPEERLNSLILIADRATLDSVKKIISQLDIPTEDKGIFHVYYCKNAVSRELASTLSSLAGGGGGISRTPTRRTTSQSGGISGTTGMTMGTTGGARETGGAVGPTSATLGGGMFEGEIKITADEPTNSLIIIASPRDYETLKQVLELLDIPRRQVFVEAVMLEVSMDQTRQAGVSMHAASPLENQGAIFASNAPSGINTLTLLSLFNQGVQLPSGLMVGAIANPITIQGEKGEITIPSAGVLVQALASDSNVNVLSTPTILTTDNEEAEIQVGQRIPVPTGQTVATGGLSSVSITRETVGIKLKLTPQINESGTIRLEISTEISNAMPSALGINVNTLGVTTSIKTASTTVIVKDAQTIVIGGLMEDRRSNATARFPFLGDLPVIGWLFKSFQKTKNKTNLIMLITPHIVRSDQDVEKLREKFKKDYDSFVEESLGAETQKWDQYFESQYGQTFGQTTGKTSGTVIDVTGGKPKVIQPGEEGPAPQAGETVTIEKPKKSSWWERYQEKKNQSKEQK